MQLDLTDGLTEPTNVPRLTTTKVVPFRGITRPMTGAQLPSFDDPHLRFPVLATPKIDGFRAFRRGAEILTRSGKEFRNPIVKATLLNLIPDGADGEITGPTGTTFQDVAKLNSKDGKVSNFVFHWFDYVVDPTETYRERTERMRAWARDHPASFEDPVCKLGLLLPTQIDDKVALAEYESECLSKGAEGIVLRRPSGLYKFSASTLREGWLLKFKRFVDAEGVVVGFRESVSNENPAEKTQVGLTKRSSRRNGLAPQGKLGSLVLLTKDGVQVKVGGFTEEQKRDLWARREELMGQFVTFKSFPQGVKNKPRHPQFLHFKERNDMPAELVEELDKVYRENAKVEKYGMTLEL